MSIYILALWFAILALIAFLFCFFTYNFFESAKYA